MKSREIKFRAWDVGKMFYTVSIGADINPSVYDGEWKECTEKAEIMQYTGLKDKNGVEIYEGDIVHIDKDRFGKGRDQVWSVEYDESEARYVVYNQLNSTRIFNIDYDSYTYCPIVSVQEDISWYPKVIGNIYETPELLEDKK